MRVVELFSGIGGMRLALKKSVEDLEASKCALAIDNSDVANRVYATNFKHQVVLQKNVEDVDLPSIFEDVDLLTMSSPCQPYTRRGKLLAERDSRSKALETVQAFEEGKKSFPKRILLENIFGFETSSQRNRLVNALKKKYYVKELLCSPAEEIFRFLPSRRPRYYMLVRR